MEEILVAVVQVVLEFVFEVLVYGGLDAAAQRVERRSKVGCLLLVAFGLVGAGLGAVASWVHPAPVLPWPWLRVANLVGGPFLAGGLSWLVARWRQGRGGRLDPALHFGMAFVFVLGFNLARFALARP